MSALGALQPPIAGFEGFFGAMAGQPADAWALLQEDEGATAKLEPEGAPRGCRRVAGCAGRSQESPAPRGAPQEAPRTPRRPADAAARAPPRPLQPARRRPPRRRRWARRRAPRRAAPAATLGATGSTTCPRRRRCAARGEAGAGRRGVAGDNARAGAPALARATLSRPAARPPLPPPPAPRPRRGAPSPPCRDVRPASPRVTCSPAPRLCSLPTSRPRRSRSSPRWSSSWRSRRNSSSASRCGRDGTGGRAAGGPRRRRHACAPTWRRHARARILARPGAGARRQSGAAPALPARPTPPLPAPSAPPPHRKSSQLLTPSPAPKHPRPPPAPTAAAAVHQRARRADGGARGDEAARPHALGPDRLSRRVGVRGGDARRAARAAAGGGGGDGRRDEQRRERHGGRRGGGRRGRRGRCAGRRRRRRRRQRLQAAAAAGAAAASRRGRRRRRPRLGRRLEPLKPLAVALVERRQRGGARADAARAAATDARGRDPPLPVLHGRGLAAPGGGEPRRRRRRRGARGARERDAAAARRHARLRERWRGLGMCWRFGARHRQLHGCAPAPPRVLAAGPAGGAALTPATATHALPPSQAWMRTSSAVNHRGTHITDPSRHGDDALWRAAVGRMTLTREQEDGLWDLFEDHSREVSALQARQHAAAEQLRGLLARDYEGRSVMMGARGQWGHRRGAGAGICPAKSWPAAARRGDARSARRRAGASAPAPSALGPAPHPPPPPVMFHRGGAAPRDGAAGRVAPEGPVVRGRAVDVRVQEHAGGAAATAGGAAAGRVLPL
jgi:hypothetical protein